MAFTPSRPVVEHHRVPFGIGEPRPRLSWTISASAQWRQAGYELEIVRRSGANTHVVRSPEQILVPWPDEPLGSRERVTVRVRVEGRDGSRSGWSPAAEIEAGLLEPSDWSARPVGGAWPEDPDSDDRRPALVRRAFEVTGQIAKARVYASAHGLYELEINGMQVGDDALSPGWTVYAKRLRYYTYDVTALLRDGENVIGSWLGDGWYRGRLGWRGGFRNLFGSDLSLIAQLEIHYADGRTQMIATDAGWLAATGPIVRTGNYDGEDYDARDERPGWSSPGYDPVGWTPVAVRDRDPATLVAPTGPPVRCTQELAPVAVLTTPSGRQVLDFGQNLVGRLRIRVRGHRGDPVVIRTAEVLQDGELYQRPLRDARSADTYVLAGRPEGEEWEPRFTFHGFRYAEIEGQAELDATRPRLPLRPGAHRLVLLLRPAARAAARERRVEHARQLRRHPDRLPAARRAGRLDGRSAGLRPHSGVPLRRLRDALLVASGRCGRAAARRDRAVVRAGDPVPRGVDADPAGRRVG